MIGLYQSHRYSAPSGPNLASTGRKLWLLDVISGCARSSTAKPAPSSDSLSDQTALLMYPPVTSAPCQSFGQCVVPTMSAPLHLRPPPLRQMSGGCAPLRFGTRPGAA